MLLRRARHSVLRDGGWRYGSCPWSKSSRLGYSATEPTSFAERRRLESRVRGLAVDAQTGRVRNVSSLGAQPKRASALAPIILKTIGVHGFDRRVNWAPPLQNQTGDHSADCLDATARCKYWRDAKSPESCMRFRGICCTDSEGTKKIMPKQNPVDPDQILQVLVRSQCREGPAAGDQKAGAHSGRATSRPHAPARRRSFSASCRGGSSGVRPACR